jgi:hypothetical protein
LIISTFQTGVNILSYTTAYFTKHKFVQVYTYLLNQICLSQMFVMGASLTGIAVMSKLEILISLHGVIAVTPAIT